MTWGAEMAVIAVTLRTSLCEGGGGGSCLSRVVKNEGAGIGVSVSHRYHTSVDRCHRNPPILVARVGAPLAREVFTRCSVV